ncbi:cell shape determination protein CcmA [Paramagnetospirillum marisnigri]|uniref:Cell shape determination protein CcmA n=1 Tax=Paramagnetospirillum marisnigri TaxID=1285242 RepID=A0A178MRF5_9PROT|nr:polymer-forming cytoskeletal protein [Paramagnetospirillum marisnigri]OAN52171.1 cell shape determination protein CcmA [Paramagnetospirillum marisnigri]
MLPKLGKAINAVSAATHGHRHSTANGLPLSVIGPDVKIVGNIYTQGEMQIDGHVEGDIACQRLLVGEGGRISGEVTAETVQVHGELTGKINASSVLITKSGRVTGDVTQDSLEIEAGASMEGRLIRRSAAAKALEAAAAHKGNGGSEPAQLAPPATPDITQEAAGNA